MKKIIFGLIATVLVSVNVNAQEISKEEARVYASKTLVSFKNSLAPSYKKGMSFEDFIKAVTGPYNPTTIPTEGSELLKVAHTYLSKGTSDKEIIASYSGREIANAFSFLQKNPTYEDSQLFGFKTGSMKSSEKGGPNADFELVGLNLEEDSLAGCKWWQVRCWLRDIFGEEGGDAVVNAIVKAIVVFLGTL